MGLFGKKKPKKEPEPETDTEITEAHLTEGKEPLEELPELPKGLKEPKLSLETKRILELLGPYMGENAVFGPLDTIPMGGSSSITFNLLAGVISELRELRTETIKYLVAIKQSIDKASNP